MNLISVRKPIRKLRSKPRPGRLKGKALQAQRVRIFERDKGLCQDCGRPTLFNAPEEWPDSFHRAHIRGKRMWKDGDDNVKTSCGDCHRMHHAGRKPVPAKVKSLLAFFLLCGTLHAQEPAKPHAFFDKTNLALFSADALVRSMDAQSTRTFLALPCQCIEETSLPMGIAGSTPRMYGYSLAVTASVMAGSWMLHRMGHHKMERMLPIADITYDGKIVVHNWQSISAGRAR